VESHVRLFLKILYGYRRAGQFQLHAFVIMPEHMHLLLTPAAGITIERAIQYIKGDTLIPWAQNSAANAKSGNADSLIIASAMGRTLRIIESTFIGIQWHGGW
jgi:REP element-mobilizing transposase RayT